MQTPKLFKTAWLFAALSIAGITVSQAQQTATWIGPKTGGEWNTAANWDLLVVPGATTNAVIGASTNVSYNVPMTAASLGILTNDGILAVNTNSFNCSLITMPLPAVTALFYLTNGFGAVNVTGNFSMVTNGSTAMVTGTSLTVGGTLGVESATSSHAAGTSTFTNSGGTLNANNTTVGASGGTGTGKLVISGGVNNLGNASVGRYGTASASTLGATEGLNIFGGVVTMSNLTASGASYGSVYISGGTVTNFGNVSINGATAGRYLRVVQAGGLFVVPDPNLIYENTTTAGTETARYQVTGGTNIIGGMYLGASNNAAAATVTVTVGGIVFVGSQGIATNGAVINTITLNSGGLLGATAPWTGSAPMNMSGSGVFTIQTADMNGNPNNITITNYGNNSVLSGPNSCTLNVTGGGILTLGATNTYAGNTLINGGTLTLTASGALASPVIIVGPGTTFDVSALAPNGGLVLKNLQTLTGSGTVNGAVNLLSGATITSGSNTLTGTLTLNNSLTETNGNAVNHFALSGAPNPNNDLIVVGGDLNVFGATNSIDIAGTSLVPGTNYIVIQYGGIFNGGTTNFVVTTAFGSLSNDPVGKTISFIPSMAQRGTTNTVWIGNPVNTNWDNEVSTNWLIASSGMLTTFDPGDSVQFTDLGASNSPVNIVGTVAPTTILINSQSNYVIASTSGGWIAGTTSLTTTNTGTLTVLTTNTYTGNTIIDGGSALSASQLASGGAPSAVGESDSLIINNGTFIYTGPSVSINRGATLGNASSAINISANGNLTLSGNLTGNGGLTMAGPGTLIMNGSSSYAGVTTFSNGILQVSATTAVGTNEFSFYGGTLKFSGESGQQFYANIFNAATTGTVVFNDGNSDGVIGTSGGGGGFSGTGVLSIDIPNAGGYCTINAHMENYAGTIHVTDDSLGLLRLNSGGNSTSVQECTGGTNVTFDLGNGSVSLINRNGAASYGNYDLGALRGGSGTFLKGSATGGSPSVYSIGALNTSTIYSGTIADGSGPSGATTAITKVGTGTLTLLGQNGYTGPTVVSNGVLALAYNPTNSEDAVINSSSSIIINAGTVIDVSGRSDGKLFLGTLVNQTLQGYGTINGKLDASSVSATVAPGDGLTGNLGTLTVTNTIYMGGTAWMKINRNASPNSDQIISSGASIIYGGTLIVTNVGPNLQVNDTFTLFGSHPFQSYSFTTVQLPGQGNNGGPYYITWDTSKLNVNGSIKVTAIAPFPKVTKAVFSGLSSGAVSFYSTNGIPDTIVNVLSATNLALPLNKWTAITNTTFNTWGDLNDPNDPDDPSMQHPGFTITNQPSSSKNPVFYILQTYGNSF